MYCCVVRGAYSLVVVETDSYSTFFFVDVSKHVEACSVDWAVNALASAKTASLARLNLVCIVYFGFASSATITSY